MSKAFSCEIAAYELEQGNKSFASNDFNAAQAHWFRVLQTARDNDGLEPLRFAALSRLARLQSLMGDFDMAQPLFDDAVSLVESGLKISQVELAECFSNLARHYFEQTKLRDALVAFKRADDAFQLGGYADELNFAEFLISYARAAEVLAKGELARELYARALQVFERALGPEHFRSRMTRLAFGKSSRLPDAENVSTSTCSKERDAAVPGKRSENR